MVGYLAGRSQIDARRSAFIVLGAVAALVGAVGAALRRRRACSSAIRASTATVVVSTSVSSVLYDLLLAPFVIPGVMALARRTALNPAQRLARC